MTDETLDPPPTETTTPDADASTEPEKPRIEWQYRQEFAIHGKMREAIKLAIDATHGELAALRRKLAKAQYGGG